MRLVNDLLDLSKMEAGKMTYSMKKVSMLQILNEGIMEFSQTVDNKGISLCLEESAEEIFLECDMYKIGQVFRNLLSNAVNFSAPGQSITISCQATDLDSEPGVAVSIQDRGVAREAPRSGRGNRECRRRRLLALAAVPFPRTRGIAVQSGYRDPGICTQ